MNSPNLHPVYLAEEIIFHCEQCRKSINKDERFPRPDRWELEELWETLWNFLRFVDGPIRMWTNDVFDPDSPPDGEPWNVTKYSECVAIHSFGLYLATGKMDTIEVYVERSLSDPSHYWYGDIAVGLDELTLNEIARCMGYWLKHEAAMWITGNAASKNLIGSHVETAGKFARPALYDTAGNRKISEMKRDRGDWMLDNCDPKELTNLELQSKANEESAKMGWPLFDSETGNGAFEAYKRAYKLRHGHSYRRDDRGKIKTAKRISETAK